MKKIYVGNLPWSTTDEDLRELFATYGTVESSAVVNDRETGRSRGFGFVTLANSDMANSAIEEMDGKELEGRAVKVNIAKERERKPRTDNYRNNERSY